MINVLRVLGSILCHLNTHTESSTESLRRLLPRNPDVPAEDSTALAPGMSAGVYLSAYEIGDQSDYPGDQMLMPLKSIAAPDDVMKIKYALQLHYFHSVFSILFTFVPIS